LKVSSGEVVGFLGRNGCGKSTLLKVIFGSLKGQSQSVRLDGKYMSVAFKSGRIKFLPQEGLFPGFLSPEKAINLYNADADTLIDIPEVREYYKFRFDQMSGGIAKFIETLIVLHTPSDFVLLDEPFSYVAPVLVERLIPTIKVISKIRGVLMTDHQYQSILSTSDRLYVLRDRSIYPVNDVQQLHDMAYIK
ncbi:MAG: ATP-binding cassette domain-containing protein, partial [Marinoscillum sp.]